MISTTTSVGLVATPWKVRWMPSLQLATLASWLHQTVPQVVVEEYHHYLEVAATLGGIRYDEICELSGLRGDRSIAMPEALYAGLLFPESRERIEKTIRDSYFAQTHGDVTVLLDSLQHTTLDSVETVARRSHAMVGLSVTFYQTFSSLYFAQVLKSLQPDVILVFGGPEVPGKVGTSILRTFSWIDFVITGEGETPLQKMCEVLSQHPRGDHLSLCSQIPGVQGQNSSEVGMPQTPDPTQVELRHLDSLPVPGFESYFANLERVGHPRPTYLTVESSRGCWWDRSNEDPHRSCSFCNLNATWSSYREKSIDRTVREIRTLVEKHGVSRIMLVDNIIRQGRQLTELLARLSTEAPQLEIVLEAKASLRPTEFYALKRAGVVEMQTGIESLSTGMLRRLINKGTSAIHNIQAMRWMEDLGIRHVGNIILQYPGVTVSELNEMIRTLEFAVSYQPLIGGQFSLGYYSPIYRLATEFGITNVRNNAWFDACLPDDVRPLFFSLEKDFDHIESEEVQELWTLISLKIAAWRSNYEDTVHRHGLRSLCMFRDHGDALEMMDWRTGYRRISFLEGPHRRLYLSATSTQYLGALLAPHENKEELRLFVDEMVERRFMFRERDRVISLFVNISEELPPPYLIIEDARKSGENRGTQFDIIGQDVSGQGEA